MDSRYVDYSFFTTPSDFAEKNLVVSDGMGYVGVNTFLINRKSFSNELIMYVLAGTLHVEQYSRKYTLHAGEGILMTLRDPHKYYSDWEDTSQVIWFHFRGDCLSRTMEPFKERDLLPLVFSSTAMEEEIYQCFEITKQREEGYEFELSAVLYRIILSVVKDKMYLLHPLNSGMDYKFGRKLSRYIDLNLYKRMTLDELADCVNMSRFHFCRTFKAHFQATPMDYVMAKKIELSKNLLTATNAKTEVIAEKLGFTDQSHFSKAFKRFAGVSPSAYRKSIS